MTPLGEEIISASYREDARSWSQDVNGALRVSRARAWWLAVIALFIAAVEALALVMLLPLKTVVPYTILVDRQTGHAEVARGIKLGPMNENEALVQSVMAQYVIARETIDATDLAANYRKVGLWSAGDARRDYLRGMDRSNPASILNSANSATLITTTVKTIALVDKSNALVRFTTERRDGNGPTDRREWVAVIRFGFSGGPLSAEDRLINPLGFQVTHYRRDQEGVAPVAAPVQASVQPTAMMPEMSQ